LHCQFVVFGVLLLKNLNVCLFEKETTLYLSVPMFSNSCADTMIHKTEEVNNPYVIMISDTYFAGGVRLCSAWTGGRVRRSFCLFQWILAPGAQVCSRSEGSS